MGKRGRGRKGGNSTPASNPTNTMDRYVTKADSNQPEEDETTPDEVTKSEPEVVTSTTEDPTPELEPVDTVQEPHVVPKTPKTPTVNYESVYPDKENEEISSDVLVPEKSPLRAGAAEPSITFGDIYQQSASPMIVSKEGGSNDSVVTEIDKVDEDALRLQSSDNDEINSTWREVDDDGKEEEISVLTENILTPERVEKERKVKDRVSTTSSGKYYQAETTEVREEAGSYPDRFGDYLETISNILIAIMAIVQPNTKHEHYEDYLKAKVNLLLWPLTFAFPSIVIELTRFFIVSSLLFAGSGFLIWWYLVKFGLWIMFSPWRLFQQGVSWIFQLFIHVAVGFVNTARGGNNIPTALNGHVMKH